MTSRSFIQYVRMNGFPQTEYSYILVPVYYHMFYHFYLYEYNAAMAAPTLILIV